MEEAVRIFAIVNCVVIGLSHAVAPRAWARYFAWLCSKGDAGVFAFAGTTLAFGSLIVAFHNVWHGLPLVVTLLGWAQVLKATVYFCFPAFGLKQLGRITEGNSRLLVWPGAALVLFSVLLAWRFWGG
jgi:hypothetical protein